MDRSAAGWSGVARQWAEAEKLTVGFDYAVPVRVAATALRMVYGLGGNSEMLAGLGMGLARSLLDGDEKVRMLESQWKRVGAVLRAEAEKVATPAHL